MTDPIGKFIGRYKILEQLGRGGMATVYKAYDSSLEREVAIKVIRREAFSPEVADHILKRFEREAKSLARLSHPNIVKIYDYGEHEGSPYLVMEFITGGALVPTPDKPMPYQEAARLLAPIARALEYAHEKRIIHRDIKPLNILLTSKGHPQLTDFGIAKLLEGEDKISLTSSGMGIGTPEYMAPEQGLGHPVDHRADIYALGSVFYELITGHKPFKGETPMAVVIKHIYDPLPRPRLDIKDLPDEVELAIYKAMAKKAGDRYQLMSEFAQVLEKISHSPARSNNNPRIYNPSPDEDLSSRKKRSAAIHAPTRKRLATPEPHHHPTIQFPTKQIELSSPTLETIIKEENTGLLPPNSAIPVIPAPPIQVEPTLIESQTQPRSIKSAMKISLGKLITRAGLTILSTAITLLILLFAAFWTLGQTIETAVGLSPIVSNEPEVQSVNEKQMENILTSTIEPYQRWIQTGKVDLQSPDRIIISLFTSLGSFKIELIVSKNERSLPQFRFVKIANLPTLFFGELISNGINRGIAHSLDQARVRITDFSLTDETIIYQIETLK